MKVNETEDMKRFEGEFSLSNVEFFGWSESSFLKIIIKFELIGWTALFVRSRNFEVFFRWSEFSTSVNTFDNPAAGSLYLNSGSIENLSLPDGQTEANL